MTHGAEPGSEEEKLVAMLNQIARFFESQAHEAGALGMADHVAAYWSRRMRERVLAHLDRGGAGLRPLTRDALAELRARPPKEAARRLEAEGGVAVAMLSTADAG